MSHLLFLFDMNKSSIDAVSTVKPFADHISLFFIARNPKNLADELNSILKNTSEWAY